MACRRTLARLFVLAAPLFLLGCVFLTKQQIQSAKFVLKTSEALPAGNLTEVYSSIYPSELKLKKNFVKIFGQLQPPGGAALPSQVTLQVVSLDANTQRVYYRFKLVLKVGGDGSYSGIKKWKKNVIPNTLQMFLVEPRGDAIPAGTVVSLCIEVVKMKAEASGDGTCSTGAGSSETGSVTTVRVLDNEFSPQTTTIQPGDRVRWVLEGNATNHTVTELDNNVFDSGSSFTIQGATFERTFTADDDGKTFKYYCRSHRQCCAMQGSVRVGNNAPDPGDEY